MAESSGTLIDATVRRCNVESFMRGQIGLFFRVRRALPWGLMLILFCGCASPVRLVQPPWFAQQIGHRPANVRIEPIAYMMSANSRSVTLRVFNLTDHPLMLLPDASYVVDPWNQSAPMRREVIAPHGSVTLKLPPKISYSVWEPIPVVPETSYRHPLPVYYPEMHESQWPPYAEDARQNSVHSAYMWKWPEGRVRIHLEYENAGKRFHHDFVFQR